MAIYNNREVTVVAPTRTAAAPANIVVQYKDGSHETVSTGRVYFTKEEKDNLVKSFPSDYDNVNVASEDDLKAVRLGVAPSSDPSIKQQAEANIRREKAEEETRKQVDAARKEADERLSKELNQPVKTTVAPVASNQKAR